nr:immunoglobulin heavy chain junction region [Macaca mulatta]MOV88374.1 immunoglobulin heavy chain junction region [Macaca mulatta]MOV89248.1 immunoglobulin heavy chain junction region [Macaca mulatta]MOV89403.1 immunoglobulin heavy chain junction region [Macaca mulatta]MOV91133.1 immunoglobulin heavy chain junction region [Macaca mulatta]
CARGDRYGLIIGHFGFW